MTRSPNPTGILQKRRYAIAFFLFTVLYHVFIVNRLEIWKVSEISYTYHIVDYGVLGFRSQLLPGAVFYGLFGERASVRAATVYETVLILLFFAGVSLFLERFMLGVEERLRPAAFVLILLYLSGPYTFAIFTDELGMLDVYWLFFSLAFFFLLERNALRWLIPVLYVLSLLIHFSCVLNYAVLFSIMLLYRASLETEKKKRVPYAVIFVLSMTASVCLFLYFLLNHAGDLPVTKEAFHETVRARGGTYTAYYDYSMFYELHGEEVVPPWVPSVGSPVMKILLTVFYKCRYTLWSYYKTLAGTLARFALAAALLSPAVCFLYRRLIRFYGTVRENRLKRFCVFLMMAQFPFTAVLGCLFSPDVSRWCTHAFLISFTMLLYVSYREEALKTQVLEAIGRLKTSPPALIYFTAYFLVHSWAYC